jgi:hypothetical protein
LPRKLSRAQRLLATIGGAVCLAGALPGAAMAAECAVQPTSKAFAEFGDQNDYYLAPGGAFETLTWASVGYVDLSLDNDPFELAPGIRSAKLNANEAVSASFCVDRTMPHLRFVAKGSYGQLEATVRTTTNGVTNTSTTTLSDADHDDVWAPSANVGLHTGGIPAGDRGTTTLTLRSTGLWRVDNVFVDPYRR